ncbi:MAG: NAD(P)-dependent oxidoreductase [Candidatus Omnitrophica bacterium]|nr:NAD(P)-dependent oxidoreductase [Candidatus Omnitrophota bacterium]
MLTPERTGHVNRQLPQVAGNTADSSMAAQNLILVGKRSYIGGYLARFAEARGARVTALSSDDCNFLQWHEVERFFRSLAEDPYTIVFLAVVNKPIATSYQSFLENTRIVKHLIDGHTLAPVNAIVYFSSMDVYGRHPRLPITEESPLEPDTWYALARQVSEWMLHSSGEVRCPVTIIRVTAAYGPAPNDPSVIGRMVRGIQEQGQVVIHGSGTTRRDYVYVGDLCRLVEAAIPLRYNGVLNTATGTCRSINEIAQMVGRVLERPFEIVHEAVNPAREFDAVFDITKLRTLLPSFQFSEMEVGVRSYLTEGGRIR